MKKVIALLSFVLTMFSCDVAQQAIGAYSLTQCEYNYDSISGLSLGGVNLSSGNVASSALALASLFTSSSGSLPMQFTLNLGVKNPGYQTALLNGLQYVLEIDGVEMTTGAVDSKLQVAPGEISKLPLNLSFDLKKAMSGQSADAVKNLAYNFIGIGSQSSKVTMKIKPALTIGNQAISSPSYIPISFNYGGKK